MHKLTARVKGCQKSSIDDIPCCATNALSMALANDEFRNRVLAAGALHGKGMREIRDLLGEFGTERTLAEAIIRGDKDQNKRNIRDLAEALEVPREWFTEPDWRVLLVGAPQPPERELEKDLAGADQKSTPSDSRTEEPGRASQNP